MNFCDKPIDGKTETCNLPLGHEGFCDGIMPVETPEGLERLPHEVTITFSGKRGEVLTWGHVPFCLFRVHEIVATDSLGGRATKVGRFFVGHMLQWRQREGDRYDAWSELVPSADLSVARLGLDHLDVNGHPLFATAFTFEFRDDCEFSITFRGEALKRPGETERQMRERVIDHMEQVECADWPEDRRREYIDLLRESYLGGVR